MRLLLFATTLTLIAGPLAAQEGQKWIGVQGGYDLQNNTERNAKDNAIVGGAAGMWLTSRWGAELSVLGTQLRSKVDATKDNELHGHLSLLMNFLPDARTCHPYLRVGLGASSVATPWSFSKDTTTRFSYHAGVGVQTFLNESFLLGLEARGVRIETLKSYTETLGLVTFGYRFGGTKAAPMAAPSPAPRPEPVPEPPAPKVEVPAPAPVVEPPPPPPTPAPAPVAPVAPAPVVEPPPPPVKIVLDEAVLHFANGRNELPPEGIQAIRKVAHSLKAFKGAYTLEVTGYTSSLGLAAFNKALSKRRADAVAKVLVEEGIPQASIKTVGMGPEQPIADNKTKAGQARNRRVEIEVKAQGQQVETRKNETSVSGL
jgi:OmpA-OmpF porin, OOP family